MKILFLPCMSTILPKETRATAVAKRYEVATQLNKIASMANSFAIEGRAILMEEPIKGARKELNVTTSNTAFLLILVFIRLSVTAIIHYLFSSY